jgi:hypothetical protein
MKIKFVLGCVLLGSQLAFAGGALDELKPADQTKVKNGEQVTITQPGPGSSWPQITVFQRLDATPEESVAVFSDYDRESEYVTDMVYSKISKRIDRASCEVGYTTITHFFLHPKESYTTRDTLSVYDRGASYRMDWKLVSANKIKDVVGNARFESLGTGTLVTYYSFITPPSLAGGESGRAISSIQQVVQKTSDRIHFLRTNNQALLQEEIAALRLAVIP